MPFIDRQRERAGLDRLVEREGAHLAVLYGRRRIGKTYLLQHLRRDRETFYYLAADTTPEFNRRQFVEELSDHLGRGDTLRPEDVGTWRAVFRELFRSADDEPLVVILDEFQYLLGGKDEVRSQLVAVWDTLQIEAPLLVVLCGSAVRTMRELDDAQAPLYGRVDWKHQLKPFDYWYTGRMAPFDDPRELARIYGALGGTPDYLARLEAQQTFAENIARTALSPSGHVRHVVESVIEQERGLRNVAQYRSILTAIAHGRTELSEIADVTGMKKDTPLRRKVARLEDLGFVEGRRNFDAARTAPYRYRLRDPALMFQYAVVDQLRNELETTEPMTIWEELVVPRLQTHMGLVFETIVRQAYHRLREARGLSTVAEWGYWQGVDRNKQSIEIDIVARLSDKSMLTGSVKWNRSPVGAEVFTQHVRALERLADSGYGWAHDALEESASMLFAAAGGFDQGFDAVVETAEADVLDWTLDDMYSDEAAGRTNIALPTR